MNFPTRPWYCNVRDYNVVAEINLDPKAETATVDLQLDPGRAIAVTPIDPEGRPVAGTVATGVGDLFPGIESPQASPTIAIHGLDPSRPRRVTVTHGGRKLIGSIELKGDEASPVTLRLQPYGTITGRIVDDDGQPRGGLRLFSPIGGDTPIGRDGRFRIEGLVPGLKYDAGATEGSMYSGDLYHDVTVAPGEVKDLGDLKVVPSKPGN
jgi:hypothetical protein